MQTTKTPDKKNKRQNKSYEQMTFMARTTATNNYKYNEPQETLIFIIATFWSQVVIHWAEFCT